MLMAAAPLLLWPHLTEEWHSHLCSLRLRLYKAFKFSSLRETLLAKHDSSDAKVMTSVHRSTCSAGM